MSSKNRSMPSLHSDEAAEDFVATVDLTQSDLMISNCAVNDYNAVIA